MGSFPSVKGTGTHVYSEGRKKTVFAVTEYLSSEPLYLLVPRLIMHGTVFTWFLQSAAQEIPDRNATGCECASSHGE